MCCNGLQNGGSAVGSAADPTAAAAAVNPAAAAAGFTAREASGSPEAPDLELEPDDELAGEQNWLLLYMRLHVVTTKAASTTEAHSMLNLSSTACSYSYKLIQE